VNNRLLLLVFVGSLGGFVLGFDLGALSAATQSLKSQLGLSPWAFGLTISASIWGTVAGAILAGRLATRIWQLNLISGCALLYALAAAGIAAPVPAKWPLVLAMRFLCGIAIGGFTVGCPLYLSEVAPIHLRGRVVGAFQLQVSAGVIAAFAVGAVCVHLAHAEAAWRWILGLAALPAAALLFILRSFNGPARLEFGGDPIRSVVRALSETTPCPAQKLFVRRNFRLILLATSIALFNQLSGVNVLLVYMVQILASGGVEFSLGHQYAVLISILSLATTMLGMAFVDRLGRKPLLYLGSLGMAACLLGLGFAIPGHYPPLVYVSIFVAYNACFAFSQGTVVWVYLSELFPSGLRGAGQGYGATVLWIANAALISIFPGMQHLSSVTVFYFFVFMMVLQVVIIWFWYPETRGTALGSFAAAEEE
jgi:MFS family permease